MIGVLWDLVERVLEYGGGVCLYMAVGVIYSRCIKLKGLNMAEGEGQWAIFDGRVQVR